MKGDYMAISYDELNPIDAEVIINNKTFTLGRFNLLAQCWANKEFSTEENKNGLENLSKNIQDWRQPEPLLKLSWYLLKEKSIFNASYEEFVNFVDNKNSKWNNIKNIFESVVKTIGVSQPQIDDMAEEIELKKSSAVENLKQKPATRSFLTFSPLVIVGLLTIFTALLCVKFSI
jgi:hypothetical protein